MGEAMTRNGFIIGIDAGGTHTRAGCFAIDGTLLGYARGGGGSPQHNDDALGNVRGTIAAAMADGGLEPGRAVQLVAGIAGRQLSAPDEQAWADEFIAADGLSCPRSAVNDAVIAHRGALSGAPGVIVVAGTGSMILAIAPDGSAVDGWRFEHYAGAARHLAFDAVQRILIGEGKEDDPLIEAALEHFGAASVDALRPVLLGRAGTARNEIKRLYGSFAPHVTALADHSALADAAVRELAGRTARGIRLVAPLSGEEPAPVACTGSLATAAAFRERLRDALDAAPGNAALLVPARLGPLGGAAITALEAAGVEPSDAVIDRLAAQPVCAPA